MIVKKYGGTLVNKDEAEAGAKTIRMMTVLGFAYYYPAILQVIYKATCQLLEQGRARHVIPVLVSSSGGGTGSASSCLVAWTLSNPAIRPKIAYGLDPHVYKPSTVFLAEPFAQASFHQESQRNKILANGLATSMELEAIAQFYRRIAVIFHLSLSNGDGVILSKMSDIDEVLGKTIMQYICCYEEINSRWADTYYTRVASDRYTGTDVGKFGFSIPFEHDFVDTNFFTGSSSDPNTDNGSDQDDEDDDDDFGEGIKSR